MASAFLLLHVMSLGELEATIHQLYMVIFDVFPGFHTSS